MCSQSHLIKNLLINLINTSEFFYNVLHAKAKYVLNTILSCISFKKVPVNSNLVRKAS